MDALTRFTQAHEDANRMLRFPCNDAECLMIEWVRNSSRQAIETIRDETKVVEGIKKHGKLSVEMRRSLSDDALARIKQHRTKLRGEVVTLLIRIIEATESQDEEPKSKIRDDI